MVRVGRRRAQFGWIAARANYPPRVVARASLRITFISRAICRQNGIDSNTANGGEYSMHDDCS